ncbi:hypothetical protein TrVFT333_006019 [Trichoderma virens FT-333]|nr:hypothetical protein TrVFT333_006019 [Trichoderma virens FT-333]
MPATSSVGGEAPTYTAEDLLSLDDGQLVEFLKRCSCPTGGYDISSASGFFTMLESRRNELCKRLTECKYPRPLDIDTLMERLASVADGPNDLREYKLPEWSEDLESTMSLSTPKFEELELMCLEELLQHGGRPVIRDIASLTSLTEKERKRLPWVHDPLFTEEVPRIFSRQADRWWDFMKWQADNRGPEAGDYGVSAYVATHLRRFSLSTDMSQSSELEDSLRRMWEVKMKRLEVPDPSLPAYQEAVKKRLASHHFTQEFRLEADPRKQDAWTTWVEYLNFEYWETDRLTASLGATERGYHDAWDNFRRIDTPQPSANFGARQEFYKDAPGRSTP